MSSVLLDNSIKPLRAAFLCKTAQNSLSSKQQGVFSWRRQADLNRRIRVLQTRALPLGYVAVLNYNRNIITREGFFVNLFLKFKQNAAGSDFHCCCSYNYMQAMNNNITYHIRLFFYL